MSRPTGSKNKPDANLPQPGYLRRTPELVAFVASLRYQERWKLNEIGQLLGLSRQRVHQILSKERKEDDA